MQDQDFRSTPSYLHIFAGLAGSFLLCLIPYFKRDAILIMATHPTTTNLIEGCLLLLMAGCGIFCLMFGFSYPLIEITNDRLIFKRPFLFYRNEIKRSDITQSLETVFLINPTYQGDEIELFHSRKLVLKLKDKKQVTFSSLEIPEYTQIRYLLRGGRVAEELTQRLEVQRRRLAQVGAGCFIVLGIFCIWKFLV